MAPVRGSSGFGPKLQRAICVWFPFKQFKRRLPSKTAGPGPTGPEMLDVRIRGEKGPPTTFDGSNYHSSWPNGLSDLRSGASFKTYLPAFGGSWLEHV